MEENSNQANYGQQQQIKLQGNQSERKLEDCDIEQPLQQQIKDAENKNQEEEAQADYEQYNQGDYEQYNEYDEYSEYMEDPAFNSLKQKISSEENKQCPMEDLFKMIQKEILKVQEWTGLQRQWALVLYQKCGWKLEKVKEFIDQKMTHLQMINFKPNSSTAVLQPGTCQICYDDQTVLIRNNCGDQYCQNCWKAQLTERMKLFNKDPFPPCSNEECQGRISPIISQHLALQDKQFKKLYQRTLCRSYATGNPSVKMCKGKAGYSCDQCFKVKKLFQLIQCEHCGNFVCGRCGEQYHKPSECFEAKNWNRIADQAFVKFQMSNHTACPNCKELIHKYVGCNWVKCICKQEFCYVCGQTWLPNHRDHFKCPRSDQMGALLIQKQKKFEDEKRYLDELQKEKKRISEYDNRLRALQAFDLKEIEFKLSSNYKILSNELDYIAPLHRALKVGILIDKNIKISKYFKNEEAAKLLSTNILEIISETEKFFTITLKHFLKEEVLNLVAKAGKISWKGTIGDPKELLNKEKDAMKKNLKLLQKCKAEI